MAINKLFNLIYLTETSKSTLQQIKQAGFDGYVAFGPYRAEIPFGVKFDYYDEPETNIEGHLERYIEWKKTTKPEFRFVDHGSVEKAKKLGVFNPTEHKYIGLFKYPVTSRGWWKNFYHMYFKLPMRISQFMKELPADAKVIGVLQAFGGEQDYVMPNKRQMDTMKWIWKWLAGDRLKGFGYFIWYNIHEPQWETMKTHPELWPRPIVP